jgi:peptide/nickel transport system substrate-binding protein
MMLERGDIDIAWDLPADIIDDLRGVKGIEIIEQPVFTQNYIGMNVGFEPLGDENVRDAIRWSIDYDGIVNEIIKGAGIKLQTFIPTGMLGYNPATPYYQNPNKAKDLLVEAGYPDGFDVELAHAAAPLARDIAAKIKSDLAKSGIRVTLTEMTSAMMYEKYRAQGLQLVLGGWGADYADPDGMAKPFADGTIKQLAWRNMYYDEYATNLTREAMVEMDTSKRIEIYAELTDYILDHGCFALIYQNVHQVALKTWVEGFYKCPLFALENFEDYYKETIYVLP